VLAAPTVGHAVGGRSQLTSVVALLAVLVVLTVGGPVLAALPTAPLGALVVYAALRLVDVAELHRIGRFRRSELSIALATTTAVLLVGVLYGVLIAAGLSILDLLRRVSRPHDGVLGYVPGLAGMHDIDDYPNAETVPGDGPGEAGPAAGSARRRVGRPDRRRTHLSDAPDRGCRVPRFSRASNCLPARHEQPRARNGRTDRSTGPSPLSRPGAADQARENRTSRGRRPTMNRTTRLITAVEHALRAPSVHNTQPWRWRIADDTIELHADWNRHLVATDPGRRDLVISCGAALHHLLVALAAQGVEVRVERLPDPENSGHLATVVVQPDAGHPGDATLFRYISRRRTDRRRMSQRPVPAAHLRDLSERAERAGTMLVPVTGPDMRDRLTSALTEGAHRQEYSPGYATELELWTRRYPAARDGIPTTSIAPLPIGGEAAAPLRRFPHGQLPQPRFFPGEGSDDDAAELLVIATSGDDVLDRLRAGEATSAVLLAATGLGLATTPLSQGFEIDATRRAIQTTVLHVPEHPQLLLRIGWPAPTATELAPTPRRDLRSVLLPS
jgi:nitroreductase